MDSYQSVKEEIKRAVDIVELIGQFVQLRKAGRNYAGLCPFHSEKDPSFTVSPARQMFHCFGCKKGGDLFAFWMTYHQVTFPQAVRDLAERYHIALPDVSGMGPVDKTRLALKESILDVNEAAAKFFHDTLCGSEKGESGRKYVERRAIPQEIISEFLLGYAADDWEGLTGFLRAKKIDPEKAAQAGLIIPRKNGTHYDRFRGRVIFPIFNMRKQVVGFGGRVLDNSLPKYLNTPETPAFQKGETLYGLHASYPHIRESGRVVLVEGYMDLLALVAHGFRQAVATLGTALTRNHIRSLKGYAKEAVVVFDSDAAGKAAALRSLALFLDEGMAARVMVLPQDEDPDSFVNKHGLNAFTELLDRAAPMFDFYMDQKLSEAGTHIEGRVGILNEMIPFLAELRSDVQRSLYAKRLSENLGISEGVVLSELRKRMTDPSWRVDKALLKQELSRGTAGRMDSVYLLNLMIHHPQTAGRLSCIDCRLLLSDPLITEIFDCMMETRHREGDVNPSEILDRLSGESAKGLFREVMLAPSIFSDDMVEKVLSDFEDKVQRLKLSAKNQEARAKGDFESLNRVLQLKKKRGSLESK
jgi:DNA primase